MAGDDMRHSSESSTDMAGLCDTHEITLAGFKIAVDACATSRDGRPSRNCRRDPGQPGQPARRHFSSNTAER